MTTKLETAHRLMKEAQKAMLLFNSRTMGRDLTEDESAEQKRLLRAEAEAAHELYRAEHSGS